MELTQAKRTELWICTVSDGCEVREAGMAMNSLG